MELKKNDDIQLHIEALTSEGAAVGHYRGMAVFVRGAAPGDEITAHIIKVSKRFAIGIIRDILTPSPHRVTPDCPVCHQCGGCAFRHVSYDEELRYKKSRVTDAMERIGHLHIPVNEPRGAAVTEHYRNKAQYPVAVENGELRAGFYAYKSHRIVPCNACQLQSEAFDACLKVFSVWVKKAKITAYDERTGQGLLRHIYLRQAKATGELMACAVINGTKLPLQDYLVQSLRAISGMTSVCMNINREKTNVILGDRTVALWGCDTITDILLGKKFVISPNAFYQVNHDQCEVLYSIASEYAALTGEETLVDIYCGAGTIGLTMAEQAGRVFGIEVVPAAIENARRNAELNGITNAEFFCGDANDGAQELKARGIHPDVVILDPPRKGCSRELLDTVEAMQPQRIVYVSCDAATLARDLAILEEKGYEAQEITPVDMFPRTPHVEAVCKLLRSDTHD